MNRKELKLYTSSEIEDIDYDLLVSSEDGTIKMTRVYIAAEVDAVMDAMEARIKELEDKVIGYKASLERNNFKICEKDARIKELEVENNTLKAELDLWRDGNIIFEQHQKEIDSLKSENARLKAQVPKWHDITKPLYTEDGVNYYDLPAEHGEYIVDCGGQVCTHSEYDPDDNDWCNVICTAKVLRWCEFPPTEESSATERENG